MGGTANGGGLPPTSTTPASPPPTPTPPQPPPPSPSLVGNDWLIVQMNYSICLAHKHFPVLSIRAITAGPSDGIRDAVRLDKKKK